ncbi:hypothetical protein ACJX0J_042299, partial [Zea mays]
TVDNDLALKIYIKARATPKVVAAFAERREFDKILIYSKQGAVNFALMMSQMEGGCPIDYNTITDLFLQVLEINLVTYPNVADAILANGMFSHYDRPRIAQLCEKAGLYLRALQHYSELPDIKCAIVNTHVIEPQATKEYSEQLGVDACIKLFEQFKSYEGLYFFLGSYLSSSEDPDIHFKYIEAAARTRQIKEVERLTRESNFYDAEKTKNFLMEAKLHDAHPLINVCDRFGFMPDLTHYLYINNMLRYIEGYVQKVVVCFDSVNSCAVPNNRLNMRTSLLLNGIDKQTVPSTMDLLGVFPTGLATSTPETNTSQSQGSSDSSVNNKSKSHSTEPVLYAYKKKRKLFGSTEEDFPPKMDLVNKYLSSESSNPLDERSPSSSLPITRKFFPIHSVDEEVRHPHITDYGEDATMGEVSTNQACLARPLDLFKDSERPIENRSPPNPSYQSCYASTSCSDHSPSTSNSDGQNLSKTSYHINHVLYCLDLPFYKRTGRIIFKMFGKEPSTIPGNLHDDIVNWLKHSPTEMEGYIRPGCLVLSMYLLMPGIAWDELEENLLQRVNSLVQSSDLDFWRKGRTWNTPELTLVSPIAVVAGQKTSLILKGRNLSIPGTQIHCTSIGKYISKEVMCSAYPGTIYDDSGVETFDLPGQLDLIIGRCFVEDLFYRGSDLANLLPVEVVTKTGSLSTLPSLKRSLRPSELLFSIKRDTKSPQGSPHNWCLLPRLQLSLITRKNEKKKQSKRKSSNEH